jgi:hypothetical protein
MKKTEGHSNKPKKFSSPSREMLALTKNLFYIHPGICYYRTGFIEEILCGFSVFSI